MAVFELTHPVGGERSPLLVEVPHASTELPDDVRKSIAAPTQGLWRDADIYVDRLYARAPNFGASLLVAQYSRYVVDLNRAADDVDAQTVFDHPSPKHTQPRGVVWRLTTDGVPTLNRPMSHRDLLARLAKYYVPYHATIESELTAARERHGFGVVLAAHSMPSVGRAGHFDTGTRRADIVPGTRGRSSADPKLIDLVDEHFRAAGLSVVHDDPYKGGHTTGHYGRPKEHWHVVQVELNRALYVDESNGGIREKNFADLQTVLDALVQKMAAFRF